MLKRLGCASILIFAPVLAQDPGPQPPPVPPAAPEAAAPAAPAAPSRPFRILDDGLLQESWFGVPVDFQSGKEIDFLWVKPGLNLAGHQIRLRSWEPAVMLQKQRDERDVKKADELTYLFPLVLRNTLGSAFGKRVKLSSSDGDLTLTGRFVDVNAGSQNAKLFIWMGAGSGTATWDLKLVDSRTNELMLAVHHRCVSGSALTEVQDKLEKWSRMFARYLSDTAVH